jgi:hypothetical protein
MSWLWLVFVMVVLVCFVVCQHCKKKASTGADAGRGFHFLKKPSSLIFPFHAAVHGKSRI